MGQPRYESRKHMIAKQIGNPPNPGYPGASKDSLLYSASTTYHRFYNDQILDRIGQLAPALGLVSATIQAIDDVEFWNNGRTIVNIASKSPVAINMSYYVARPNSTDASNRHALMLDYLSTKYATLFVNAVHNTNADAHPMSYAFNSIKVGSLARVNGIYNSVLNLPPTPIGSRSLVEIVAPGEELSLAYYTRFGDPEFSFTGESGTK